MDRQTILVVDDTEANVEILLEALSGDYEVSVAMDGLSALEAIGEDQPDLILLDIVMPKMDGYEVLERMKNDKSLSHIPVIMITAIDEIESAARCIQKGADDYLVKPFNPTLLKARIVGSLEKKRLHDENMNLLNKVLEQQKQMERELDIAEKVQKTMLPAKEQYENLKHCKVETYYRAATIIGGDFYQIYEYGENKVAFMIADVAGHGPAAALIVSAIKTILENDIGNHSYPSHLIKTLNGKLKKVIPEDYFATVFFGIANFTENTLTYTCAGHPGPFLFGKRHNEAVQLKTNGPMVGMFDDSTFSENEIAFQPGDKLVLYTDGAYEITNNDGDMYGIKRLKELIHSKCELSCENFIKNIVEEIDDFWDGKSDRDDIAFVGVEFNK